MHGPRPPGRLLRVHFPTLDEDIEHIRGTRERVGDAVELGVDANQGWRVAVVADAPRWSLERAMAFCRAAEQAGMSWVEEPLAMDAYDELVKLRAGTKVDITGGELNGSGLPELSVMLERGCYDVYQPDAVMTGGIAQMFEFVRRVEVAGSRYSPHTWTNGIGFAINLQLFAATSFRGRARLEYPIAPPGWVPEGRDGLLATPWKHRRGKLELPTLPGLGFEIDRRALRRFGSRFFTATQVRVAVSAVLDKGIATARKLGEVRDARLAARSRDLDLQLKERSAAQLGLEAAAALGPRLDALGHGVVDAGE